MKEQKSNIYYLTLTGIMMAITLVMKVIFYFIPFLNGYGIEFQLVGYVYGLILIKNKKWSWTFGLLTPWLLLVIPPSFVNILDMLWEYIVALYIFLPFIYFDCLVVLINKRLKKPIYQLITGMISFSLILIALIFLKLFIHTIAGIWWWTPGKWWGSFMVNLPIYGVTLAIDLPVCLLTYPTIRKFKESEPM